MVAYRAYDHQHGISGAAKIMAMAYLANNDIWQQHGSAQTSAAGARHGSLNNISGGAAGGSSMRSASYGAGIASSRRCSRVVLARNSKHRSASSGNGGAQRATSNESDVATALTLEKINIISIIAPFITRCAQQNMA